MNALKRAHDSVKLGDFSNNIELNVEEIIFYKIEKNCQSFKFL